MRLGVVSDTHGELENLREAGQWLVQEKQVEVIVHLGDDWEDARVLEPLGVEIIKVPGVFSAYYQAPQVPNRLIRNVGPWRVLLTHTREKHKNDLPLDPDPEELIDKGKVDVVVYGHTHIPAIEKKGRAVMVNPGHLKEGDKKGYGPSFAWLELGQDKMTAQIIDLKTKNVVDCWDD